MRDYPYVTNPRRRTVLPEPLQLALLQLRSRFKSRGIKPSEVNNIVSGLSQLPAGVYRRAAREIVDMADLYWQYEPERSLRGRVVNLVWPAKTDKTFLRETPRLEYLYIFHGDGYLREEALGKINEPLTSAFFFNSIAYRLNDWVEPVRKAAQACADRVFPQTSASVIAEAAFVLLQRVRYWKRWDRGSTILEQTLARPDVKAQLITLIETASTGSPGRVLTYLLRGEGLDEHLLHLSQKAVQPIVRSIALKALISGYASWPNGFTYEWTNKALGQRKRIVDYRIRQLPRPVPVGVLIAQGAADKAAMVRRVAADGLVQHRKILSNVDELVSIFARDKTPAVRERAIFIIRERAGELS